MNVLVLGADGYLGWPLVCCLAKTQSPIIAVDSEFKRSIAASIGVDSLFRFHLSLIELMNLLKRRKLTASQLRQI